MKMLVSAFAGLLVVSALGSVGLGGVAAAGHDGDTQRICTKRICDPTQM